MIELLSQAFIWLGGILVLLGSIGLLRFPDFYTRTHASTLVSVGGFTLSLIGIALQTPAGVYTVKILMILSVNLITNPTATHALADSAYKLGIMPKSLVRNDLKGRSSE